MRNEMILAREAERAGIPMISSRELRDLSRFDRSKWERGRGQQFTARRANPRVSGVEEYLDWYLYDQFSVNANTAWPNKTTLFANQVGASAAKNLAATNMPAQGRLSGNQRFTVATVQVFVFNLTTPTDLVAMIANLSLQVFFNGKAYAAGPINLYPAGCGGILTAIAEVGTVATGDAQAWTTSNGVPDVRSVHTFKPPIDIDENDSISAVITAENAFTTQANTTRPPGQGVTIEVILAGKLFRPVT